MTMTFGLDRDRLYYVYLGSSERAFFMQRLDVNRNSPPIIAYI